LPKDLEEAVLFTNEEFNKLRNRIVELHREKDDEIRRREDLQKDMK